MATRIIAETSDNYMQRTHLRFLVANANNGTERLTINPYGNIGINQDNPTANLEVCPSDSATDTATIFINAENHDTNVASEAILKFGYGHSGSPDGVGYIKLVENATNSFDADFRIGLPTNNQSGGSVTNERVRITSGGNVNIGGDYTQTSRKVMINSGSTNAQLELKGIEADIWMHSTGPGNTVWRIMGATGNSTHLFRVYDQTNTTNRLTITSGGNVTVSYTHLRAHETREDRACPLLG